MRILMVAPPAFPVSPGTGGSVEICMFEIGRRLAKHHQVTILSRKSAGLPKESRCNNLKIVRIPTGDYWNRAIRFAKKKRYDAIQVDNRPHVIPLLKSHFPSTPIVLILHSLTFMRTLNDQQQRRVLKDAHAILCNSHFVRNFYRKRFPASASKIHAIHLGTDNRRFRIPTKAEKKRERTRYSIGNTYNILSVGRIIPKKGVELLIQAASLVKNKHPSIRVVLVGPCHQNYRIKLAALAKRLRVPLTFVGKVSPSATHRAYWLGDCFVCPTQFEEAFGLVNVEAMASGLPVIASQRGGIPEILNGLNGMIVRQYRNPQAFSQAIMKLISSPSLSRNLAYAGHATALQRFGWNRVAAEYQRFYSKWNRG